MCKSQSAFPIRASVFEMGLELTDTREIYVTSWEVSHHIQVISEEMFELYKTISEMMHGFWEYLIFDIIPIKCIRYMGR